MFLILSNIYHQIFTLYYFIVILLYYIYIDHPIFTHICSVHAMYHLDLSKYSAPTGLTLK